MTVKKVKDYLRKIQDDAIELGQIATDPDMERIRANILEYTIKAWRALK